MINFLMLAVLIMHIIVLPIYLFLSWNFGYWRKRGLLTALPLTIFGSFPSVVTRNRNIIYEIDAIYSRCKSRAGLVGFYFLRQPQIMILDKCMARGILEYNFEAFQNTASSVWMNKKKKHKSDKLAWYSPLWSNGKKWKVNRKIASNAVAPCKLRKAYDIWLDANDRLQYFLQHKITSKDTVDITDLSKRYVAHVFCSFVWGLDVHSLCNTKPNPLLQMVDKSLQETQSLRGYSFMAAVMPIFSKMWPFRILSKTVDKYFTRLTEDAILTQQQHQSNTFLSEMLKKHVNDETTLNKLAGHCTSMLLDGFADTYHTLIYVLYYLARDQRIQAKLRDEIFAFSNYSTCEELPFANLMTLPYLDQCVHETLRLSPISPYCRRVCTKTSNIPLSKTKSTTIDENTTLLIPSYSFHHDADIFPEPNSFNPERFETRTHDEFTDRYVFLPFGAGPRSCLGKNLALLTIKSAVAFLISQYTIDSSHVTQNANNNNVDSFLLNLNDKLILEFKKI